MFVCVGVFVYMNVPFAKPSIEELLCVCVCVCLVFPPIVVVPIQIRDSSAFMGRAV